MIKRMFFKSVFFKKRFEKLIYICINGNSFKVIYYE